jgi:large subunit ribosomal protein L22
MNIFTAKCVGLNSTPRKTRSVCDLIRNKPIKSATEILRYCEKKNLAVAINKLLNSCIEQATKSETTQLENLQISKIFVDEGISYKRIQPRAQGRAFKIKHRLSNITIQLSER